MRGTPLSVRHKNCLSAGVAVCLLTLLGAATAAGQPPGLDLAALERTALEELKATNTPGAAIAIVTADDMVLARGFGIANVETGAPVTPDMLFRLGSTTKMFTAAAVVALALEGKIGLDRRSPVRGYSLG